MLETERARIWLRVLLRASLAVEVALYAFFPFAVRWEARPGLLAVPEHSAKPVEVVRGLAQLHDAPVQALGPQVQIRVQDDACIEDSLDMWIHTDTARSTWDWDSSKDQVLLDSDNQQHRKDVEAIPPGYGTGFPKSALEVALRGSSWGEEHATRGVDA